MGLIFLTFRILNQIKEGCWTILHILRNWMYPATIFFNFPQQPQNQENPLQSFKHILSWKVSSPGEFWRIWRWEVKIVKCLGHPDAADSALALGLGEIWQFLPGIKQRTESGLWAHIFSFLDSFCIIRTPRESQGLGKLNYWTAQILLLQIVPLSLDLCQLYLTICHCSCVKMTLKV